MSIAKKNIDPAQIPGALLHEYERVLTERSEWPGTVIRYEEAPKGWTQSNGKPRPFPMRAYYIDGVKVPSVTTMLKKITHKEALVKHREKQAAKKAHDAAIAELEEQIQPEPTVAPATIVANEMSRQELVKQATLLEIPGRSRMSKMELAEVVTEKADKIPTVSAAKSKAKTKVERTKEAAMIAALKAQDEKLPPKEDPATRGDGIHEAINAWAGTCELPNPKDFPAEQQGYLRGFRKWIELVDPMPLQSEFLVCSKHHEYAGRVDLLVEIDNITTVIDIKSSKDIRIWPDAHFQVALYRIAMQECGDGFPPQATVVVLGPDGQLREMNCMVRTPQAKAAIAWGHALSDVDEACKAYNQAQRWMAHNER